MIGVVIFGVVLALIVLVSLNIKKLNGKDNGNMTMTRNSNVENINDRIDRAMMNYSKDLSKYNVGAKSYEYNFIDNEQPLNGLSPDFNQNYPSTLKKANKMFVDPDLSIKYINLLNTPNNSLKNYNYKS